MEDDGGDNDFLVDDEGYGYADRGGDIWDDYGDGHDVADPSRGKRRKKQAAGVSLPFNDHFSVDLNIRN